MTSREPTSMLPLSDEVVPHSRQEVWTNWIYRLVFGAIGWPWLLYSLWGGTRASKARLLDRIGLAPDALPHLGSWKADTGFLHRIVDAIEELQPRTVVELGAGASTLVCARALARNGAGRLVSFDQHAGFVTATERWLRAEGVDAELRHAPLQQRSADWPGWWYDLDEVPDSIDLLIIDGPPWTVHPYVRGAADSLFPRLTPGAIVLLDDAARPGERVIAKRWRQRWPNMIFERLPGGTKGTLIGKIDSGSADVVALPPRSANDNFVSSLRRSAAMVALIAFGWFAHDLGEELLPSASAATFLDEASNFYETSLTRQNFPSQLGSDMPEYEEISSATGISLPDLPTNWRLMDVQLYPSDREIAASLVLQTERGELVSLFAKRAETPAENFPLLAHRDRRSIAYWEAGPFAYALTGELDSERMLRLAAEIAAAKKPEAA